MMIRDKKQVPGHREYWYAVYPIGLLLVMATLLWFRPRVGPAALALVFAPYLFVPLLLLIPAALRRNRVFLRMSLLSAALCFPLIVPPALNVRAAPQPAELRALSWNVYVGGVPQEQLHQVIEARNPDVIALQEVDWRELERDQWLIERYPYRLTHPDQVAPGLALLSRLPILDSGVPEIDPQVWDMPRVMWARIAAERPVMLVHAHPIPPRTFDDGCPLPSCYNRGPRDAQIRALHQIVQALRSSGEPLLVLGDMNVNDREEAYFDLSQGLIDVHRAVGLGFGNSWRPSVLQVLPGLIRIDYMFAGNGLQPVSFDTDCTWRGSDHCLIFGTFVL